MSDWVKLHRLLLDWEWFTTPNMVLFWVYCLLRASYMEHSYKGIKLEEGQFVDGRKAMAFRTGLTEQQIRTCIERLKSTNELTSKSTNEYTIFTINSWKKYQITKPDNQPKPQPVTNEQPTDNHIQEGNKGNKGRKNTDGVAVPESLLSISGFKESWEMWLEHLRQKKSKPTSLALQSHLKKLETARDPIAMIEKAIFRNWQSIFIDQADEKQTSQEQPKWTISKFKPRDYLDD